MPFILFAIALFGLVGCNNDHGPSADADAQQTQYPGCVDQNLDGIIQPCLECPELNEDGCLESWILATNSNEVSEQPSFYQTLQFPIDSMEIGPRACVLTRSYTLTNNFRRSETLTLSQDGKVLVWSTDGIDDENTTLDEVVFDGTSPLRLTMVNNDQEEVIEIIVPNQASAASINKAEQCASAFVPNGPVSVIDFEQPNRNLFIGGSSSLGSDAAESIIAFFVIDGILSDAEFDLAQLVADRSVPSTSVRCAVAEWVTDTLDMVDHTLQLSAQSAAQSQQNSTLMVDDAARPFNPFFSGSRASIRFLPRSVDIWGAPNRIQLSRSGSIDGDYYNESVSCALDRGLAPIDLDPNALFEPWLGDQAPNVTARMLWESTDQPLVAHPLIERREVLSAQRSY